MGVTDDAHFCLVGNGLKVGGLGRHFASVASGALQRHLLDVDLLLVRRAQLRSITINLNCNNRKTGAVFKLTLTLIPGTGKACDGGVSFSTKRKNSLPPKKQD